MAENETPNDEPVTDEPVDQQVEVQAEPEATADAPVEEPESAPEPAAEEPASGEADAESVAEGEPATGAPAPEPEDEAEAAPVAELKRKRKRVPRATRRQRPKPKRESPKERKPIVRLTKPEAARGARQERRGVVVSSATDKTIVVRVETVKSHPRYKKIIRRSAKLHAHDERNEAKPGDVVRIVETRPLSKTKRWRLVEILEVAK
jgi:small subunit ribosomal protein S17